MFFDGHAPGGEDTVKALRYAEIAKKQASNDFQSILKEITNSRAEKVGFLQKIKGKFGV